MKLISAHIKNFRLLKDLKLDFCTDGEKPLTVIRAANETGKTTCEYALMWGLYGKKVLPDKGRYALFPADEADRGTKRVEVSVAIEFSIELATSAKGRQASDTRRYRAIRSRQETAISDPNAPEVFKVYKISSQGTEPLEDHEARRVVQTALPEALRSVYFTDGDRAMSFIEAAATAGVKRKRVSEAVESLLGLETLQATCKHLGNVAKKFSSEVDNRDYVGDLEALNDRINGFEEDLLEWSEVLAEKEAEAEKAQEGLKRAQQDIAQVLKLGDREKLVERQQTLIKQKTNAENSSKNALVGCLSLTKSESFTIALLDAHVRNALLPLNEMRQEKKLPKANVPILQELLDKDDCFCGADLSERSDEGRARRLLIEDAISKSQESDAIQEVATSLFFRARGLKLENAAEDFKSAYSTTMQDYLNAENAITSCESGLEDLKKDIDQIEDSQLDHLKNLEEQYSNKLSAARTEIGSKQAQIEDAKSRKSDAERERKTIETRVGKSDQGGARLTLARQAEEILQSVIEKLKTDELKKVSVEMNRIFLEMIGADPEGNDLTAITKTELTEDFDIRVYGASGVELNPDQDLNGASRRAITLAFILALTKVSEVEAPNVIDTPLGMMSGYVKQSVLLQTLKESSQVILFLTHDEIKGVEEILDQYAGQIFTLTNPAHFPRMLKNQPSVNDLRIIRCECNHRATCETCERLDARVS